MNNKKKFVQVGVGGRARFFYEALAQQYTDTSELVAFCDVNHLRLEFAQRNMMENFNYSKINLYGADEFDKMIEIEKPDCVIVTSIDRTHHHYIIRAMELGCDVITEKPMTTDNIKCQQIIDTVKRTGKNLRVSFNYRYAPHHSQVKQLMMEGVIGDVKQIHFEWLLDTYHGADYFRRWHRDKRNSGGLLVHKATHHFDLVNFWLNTHPMQVFAFGDLMFYGRENAENRGVNQFYYRAHGAENAKNDPFALQMEGSELMENLYLKAEKADGYLRDQSVFGDGISIEDVMNVLVKYENGAIMSYSLNAFSPKEGFRVVFTGTKGRMEVEETEVSYVNSGGDKNMEGASKTRSIKVFPMFGESYDIEMKQGFGGHGGGDPVLLNDLFGVPAPDPLNRAASHIDGAMSILTGIAANKSISTGMPVNIYDLIKF
ncbi:MAG: Gfo/Idh/MocA family oxidoreductase [Ruminococcaceae bacterium]|nr:Gfo/Idh/MocA family oxidoreductase [Oscillospiraceae bacterium]